MTKKNKQQEVIKDKKDKQEKITVPVSNVNSTIKLNVRPSQSGKTTLVGFLAGTGIVNIPEVGEVLITFNSNAVYTKDPRV